MDQLSKLGPVQATIKFWNSLAGSQKFVTVLFVVTSIALLGIVSVVATRPRMEVLFSGLEPEDAGAIAAKLQERHVQYDVGGDGAVIKVPAKEVHEMRLQMASAGLPQGGNVGFEIFDKTNLGMTEFAQRLNYQRALQGELSRTISTLDRVEQARVHVSIPEQDVFEDREKHPQASVVVKLRPGGSLAADQVGGIVHLVASAVQDMKPNYVTVVDTRGNVLSEASDSADGLDARMTASQMQVKQAYESAMRKDIESMIERALGPNKAVVRVAAKMDFDRTETSSETYEPAAQTGPAREQRGILLSEQRLEETYGGGSAAGVGGVVGVRANTRPTPAVQTAEAEGGYKRLETTTKYEVSRTTEHTVKLPGAVEKVSVAVMLDSSVGSEKAASIQSVVQAAAGIDPKRGDTVIVETVAFDNKAAKQEEKELKSIAAKETYFSVGKTAGGVILLLGFLFLIRGLLKQVKLTLPEPAIAGRAAQLMGAGGGTGALGAAAGSAPGVGYDSPEVGRPNPEDVAQVVKQWIRPE